MCTLTLTPPHPNIWLCFFAIVQCLQFKSDQAQDAKKMEKLNNLFFALMARGPDGKKTKYKLNYDFNLKAKYKAIDVIGYTQEVHYFTSLIFI